MLYRAVAGLASGSTGPGGDHRDEQAGGRAVEEPADGGDEPGYQADSDHNSPSSAAAGSGVVSKSLRRPGRPAAWLVRASRSRTARRAASLAVDGRAAGSLAVSPATRAATCAGTASGSGGQSRRASAASPPVPVNGGAAGHALPGDDARRGQVAGPGGGGAVDSLPGEVMPGCHQPPVDSVPR